MQLYKLDFPNNKSYIGITSKIAEERFKAHCWKSSKKNPVQHAIHKYGKENIKLTVLITVDDWELLCLAEKEAIEKFNTFTPNGYNLTLGGEGNMTINLFGEERLERDKNIKKETDKRYYLENKEKVKEYFAKYKKDKLSILQEKSKEYYQKNKELIKNKTKEYSIKNAESIKIKQKEYAKSKKESLALYGKKYRENNKEIIAEQKRIWALNNKEKILEYQKRFREKKKLEKLMNRN